MNHLNRSLLHLLRHALRFASRSSDLHTRWTQQAVTHLVSTTVFSRHHAIALRFDFDGINRFVQLRVKCFSNRRDRLNARSYERALDAASESLSVRYAMNMRPATERYAAIGTPNQVAEKIRAFHAAGVRHLSLDLVGPYERRGEQFERFAAEVRPLIKDLMA